MCASKPLLDVHRWSTRPVRNAQCPRSRLVTLVWSMSGPGGEGTFRPLWRPEYAVPQTFCRMATRWFPNTAVSWWNIWDISVVVRGGRNYSLRGKVYIYTLNIFKAPINGWIDRDTIDSWCVWCKHSVFVKNWWYSSGCVVFLVRYWELGTIYSYTLTLNVPKTAEDPRRSQRISYGKKYLKLRGSEQDCCFAAEFRLPCGR